MSEYDYLNARVRAASCEFLPAELIRQIVAARGEEIVVDLLLDSPYAPSISRAVENSREPRAAEAAIKLHLGERLQRLVAIAPPAPRRLIEAQLARWDIANVLAILRGLRRGARAEDIARSTLPAGTLSAARLSELCAGTEEAAVAEASEALGLKLSTALDLSALKSGGEPDPSALERELLGLYYDRLTRDLDPRKDDEAILLGQIRLQIDLENVMWALRRVDSPSRGGTEAPMTPLAGGKIGRSRLAAIASSPDTLGALELLDGTPFGAAMRRGLLAFGRSGRLSAIERFLEAVVVRTGAALARGDRLSAAIPLGYIWRCVAEYMDLRTIFHGKRFGMPPAAIAEELIFG